MRYPVNLIPGLPVTPDVGIGIALTPVAPPAPAAASAAGAVSGDVRAYWAFHPFVGAGDDALSIERGDAGGSNQVATSVPPDAYMDDFGYADEAHFLVVAMVRNAPDGAAITWDISAPTAASGASPSIADLGGGEFDVMFDGVWHYAVRLNNNKVVCYYTYPFSAGSSYAAWSLNPISLTPSVDGEPLRTLTLNVSALAFGGF